VRLRALDFWFGYNLKYSLVPAMTWPALTICVAGLAWSLLNWRRTAGLDRLLAIYVFVFYLGPELVRLKDMRYMIPTVPALLYFGCRIAEQAWQASPAVWRRAAVFAAASLGLILCPLNKSIRLVHSMGDDTRARAERWLNEHGGKALVEEYAGLHPGVWSAASLDVARARQEGFNYIVVSSFQYEYYAFGSRLRQQPETVYRTNQRYLELFKMPYVEIAPRFESFGFNNPVIRIVDIRNSR
jgi:hypothetical protein